MDMPGGPPSMAVPLAVIALMALFYGAASFLSLRSDRRRWSGWRIAAFMAGCATLALALVPALLPYGEGDFRQHMVQHLLLGMLGPLGLVMGAPVTLALRTLPARAGRAIAIALRSTPVRIIAYPLVALVLNLGGMAALYFTSLYTAMMVHPALHYLVHFHFVAAGCLYAWVIAGPDPAPARPSVPVRLVILGVAVVIHSVLAQMLYAGIGVVVPVPVAQLRQAAELMYYGGDITEMLLAFALVSTWRPARRTRPEAGSLERRNGPTVRIESTAAG